MASQGETTLTIPDVSLKARGRRLRGTLLLVMGCLAILSPFFAGTLALFLVGLLLIACGVLEMLETFQASDGEVVLAVGNDDLWRKFCRVAGLEAHAADPRFTTNRERVRNYDVLRPLVAEAFSQRTRDEWLTLLNETGIPAGPVRNLHEVLTDEQLIARDMVHLLQHSVAGPVRVLGVPVKLSDTRGTVRCPPPALGEHTEEVLTRDLGVKAAELAALRADGVL